MAMRRGAAIRPRVGAMQASPVGRGPTTGAGDAPSRLAAAALQKARPTYLGRNARPDCFAGPGAHEPRIARVEQRAAGAARGVAVQQADAAFPGARDAAARTRALVGELAHPAGADP